MDWDGIQACFCCFPPPPAAPETLCFREFEIYSNSLDFYIHQPCPSSALQLNSQRTKVVSFFFSFRQSALKEFSTQFGPPTQPAPLLVPKTINQKDFYPTSLPVSGIGQPQTSGLETGIFHSMRLRLKGLHTGSKQRLAPLCQWQYSYAS